MEEKVFKEQHKKIWTWMETYMQFKLFLALYYILIVIIQFHF
jgi:hypothetical protein